MKMSDNTVASLNGLFKEKYGDKLENIIPDGVKLMKMIAFQQKEKQLGNLYHQPVVLGLEHGVTFNDGDGSAFALNGAVAGQIKDAQVRGNELVLRSTLSYAAASRAVSGNDRAFMDATKFLVANMVRSLARKLEIELLYGQDEYGVVSAATDAPNTVSISTAEWASGIWAGAENMIIQITSADTLTSRGEFTIVSVDMDLRKLTLSAAPVAAGVIATDRVFHKGALNKEFAGIHKILTNTGTLFNISATSFSLWKGVEYSAGSADLSFDKINSAIARGVEKGLDSDVTCLVNPRTWSNLLSDQAALRRYDGSYKSDEAVAGHKSLKFYAQCGMIEIVPSIYVKEGYAYILNMEDYMRVGSTDVTFRRPSQGDEFFRDLEANAGYELRAYTDQALFCMAPGRSILIKDIVNS